MKGVEREDDETDAMTLLRMAGARPAPSAARTAAARAFVHDAWRSGVRQRRARAALSLVAAVLAGVALAVAAVRITRQGSGAARAPIAAAVVVARLDAATGPITSECAAARATLGPRESLRVGCRVATGLATAGFVVDGGRSVRIAPGSLVHWETRDRLSLESGAVYVDSGARAGADPPFEVRTLRGTVRDYGTQFEVRLAATELRVRVREGSVSVSGRAAVVEVGSGKELRVVDDGAHERSVPAHDAEWSWVLALAPAFEIDGRTLDEVVSWAAREAGWQVRYHDAQSARRAREARLRGSIDGLRPDEALLAVIPSTDLPYRYHDGVLHIGPERPNSSVR